MNILSSFDTELQPMRARDWARILLTYGKPDNRRAVFETVWTIVPFMAIWALTAALVASGYWAALVLTVPAAAFLLRIFIIQHDCGHGAFFTSRKANNWVGRIFGVLTVTPYAWWNYAHKMHHSGAGSLSRRGIGDIKTLTVAEYTALSPAKRFKYRLYRNPVVMFVLGPAYIFLLDQRMPFGQMNMGWKPWVSVMGTNLSIAVLWGALAWLVGWKVFLAIQLPIVLMAAMAGVWLFYVQHQFEETIWEHDPEWSFHEAALYGSSHYDLPQPLRWFSGNIGLHHVHHLSSRIPFYKLPLVVRENPELYEINRMTIRESIACVKLALWDESRRILVPIRGATAA